MFGRTKRDHASPKEIEMKEIKKFKFRFQIDPNLINLNFSALNTVDFRKEFNRIPKKFFVDAKITNDPLPDDIWIKIFSFLNVPELMSLMISCKKIANLANDDETRERIYFEKNKPRFFNSMKVTYPEALLGDNRKSELLNFIPHHFASDEQPVRIHKRN